MTEILKFKLALLTTVAIAGCGSPPSLLQSEAVPLEATATSTTNPMSCVERSAAARPPKHPIVELAWCIAETDELFDPDHLFHDTLGIEKYTTSEGITWGLKTGGDPNKNVKLPKGIRYFTFQRTSPKGNSEPGLRNLLIDLDYQKVCVKMPDVKATFGDDSWLSPIQVSAPAPANKNFPFASREISGPADIFYKSPRLFMRDISGSVSFDFRNNECVEHISIQRALDFNTYLKMQGIKK
jgi:hypothetical protein